METHAPSETSDTPTHKQIYPPKRSNSNDDVEGEPSDEMSFSRLLADIRHEEKVEDRKQKAQSEGRHR